MMTLKYLSSGKIEVAYRPTHLHPVRPQDLKHQPISPQTNDHISKLLAWNVPPGKVVESLRDDSYQRANRLKRDSIKLKRDNLVKKKTITERMRKKRALLRFANEDMDAVYMKVMTLQQEDYNPVLLYKPLGGEVVIGPKGSENIPEHFFVLALQTREQLEMMAEGCKEILVVDETHGTNPYGYQLLNLVVRDKFNLGYPVGHALCYPSEEVALQYVFKAIKERCPDIKINCCITDDDKKLINSVNAGFGEEIWHLLCIWHIHRTVQTNLRENITGIKSNDLITEVYGILCVLIDEPDESQFHRLKDSFLEEYALNCPLFIKYFNKTFLPKARQWAKCYRHKPHAETDTTMLVESFHNILKTHYMKRVPLKRLDDLMDLLLTIEEDYFTRFSNAIQLNMMSDKDHTALCKRHSKGIEIKDCDVTRLSERQWTVKSQDKNSTEVYKVIMCADQCSSDSCIYVCCYCDSLCSHLFTCSCPDIFPLCKHLHKIFSIVESSKPLEKEKKEPEFFSVPTENNIEIVEETSAKSLSSKQDNNVQERIRKIREIMQDFDSTYLDISPVKRLLPRIETTLKDLQTQCKVLCFDPVPSALPEVDVKIQMAPNEKLHKQLKPFVKKLKKRNKKKLEKPRKQCAKEIKEFLLRPTEQQEGSDNIDSELDTLSELNYKPASNEEPNSDTNDPLDIILEYEASADCDNPLETILEYKGIKVLSIHLKALHPTICAEELPRLLQADPTFVHGWLYDEVINAYLKKILNENAFACDTTVAKRLCSGNHTFKSLHLKLSSKKIILFPGNSGNHWIMIIAQVETSCLWLYNSLSTPEIVLSPFERNFLSSVALFLRNVFPLIKSWNPKRYFDVQKDNVSCGVHVCWFAQCFIVQSVLIPLQDVSEFRKEIYNCITSRD